MDFNVEPACSVKKFETEWRARQFSVDQARRASLHHFLLGAVLGATKKPNHRKKTTPNDSTLCCYGIVQAASTPNDDDDNNNKHCYL